MPVEQRLRVLLPIWQWFAVPCNPDVEKLLTLLSLAAASAPTAPSEEDSAVLSLEESASRNRTLSWASAAGADGENPAQLEADAEVSTRSAVFAAAARCTLQHSRVVTRMMCNVCAGARIRA